MKKQKIEKRPTRARRAVKSVVIMLCALLICNMLGGGHLTRAMALRDGEQRYGVYEKTHEITSLPAENIYKTLRVTLMASECDLLRREPFLHLAWLAGRFRCAA